MYLPVESPAPVLIPHPAVRNTSRKGLEKPPFPLSVPFVVEVFCLPAPKSVCIIEKSPPPLTLGYCILMVLIIVFILNIHSMNEKVDHFFAFGQYIHFQDSV